MKISKFIALVLAVCVSILAFSLAVSATDEYTLKAVREQQLKVLDYYCQGKIDYATYIEKSNELTTMLYDETSATGYISAEAEKIGNTFKGISHKIASTFETYGEAGYEYVNNSIRDYFDSYTVCNQIEDPNSEYNTNGYGCLVVSIRTKYNNFYEKAYCEYAVLSSDNTVAVYGDGYIEQYDVKTGNLVNTIPIYSNGSNPSYGGTFVDNADYRREVYGDLRYGDGTPADDVAQDIVYIEDQTLDFTNTPTYEMDDLLNSILEALERTEPDLSNVEGLLNSIYFRLGQIDSDNDNALLAEINAAILSLANSNNANTAQLILKLDEIKQALNPEGENENPEEQQPTDLTGVIDELKEINAGIKGLAAIEVVENIWELTEGEQQLFNEYASLIPLIVEKLGLGLVQATMSDIESLIFTSSPPSDLTVEMYGSEYALLSRDMFNEESLKYINLAKNFVTVLIIYAWCMSMRKKLGGVE